MTPRTNYDKLPHQCSTASPRSGGCYTARRRLFLKWRKNMSLGSADYRSERPSFVCKALCSRDFTRILKTTRRLNDLSSSPITPTTSTGSALPLPVAETKSRKHLWFAEELDSGLLSSTSRLSCTTEIERAWLNFK